MSRAPKQLKGKANREMARRMRDWHWQFADRVAAAGTLWWCWWDKAGRYRDLAARPVDVYVTGLIDGMELMEWLRSHRDWWIIGKWNDDRYAAPIEITPKGRRALKRRSRYDMEPVTGGMVEPGWQCVPLPPSKSARAEAGT